VGAAANSVGATTTFAGMPLPDDPDDDAGFIPPLPQDDRLWRHPSEMAGPRGAPTPVPRRRSPHSGLIAFLLIGAVTATMTIAALGAFTSGGSPSGTELAVGPAAEILPANVVATLGPAVVQITVDGPSQSTVVTGLLVRPDGHVITAADPLRDARSLTVTLADGRSFNATLVGIDAADDLALIDIEASGLTTPTLGDASRVGPGETVFVISRTESDRRSWVAAATFQSTDLRLETNDGSSMHGMIGSTLDSVPPTPSAVLCTSEGTVIGILTSRAAAIDRKMVLESAPSTLALPQAVNAFAHSMSWTTHVVDDLIEHGRVHYAWLGVMSTDAQDGGALVTSVVADGPADSAGIRENDVITALNDRPIKQTEDLLVALRLFSANDLVALSIVRGDQRLLLTAQLSDRT
jgi:putative serine protease PepD